MNQLLTEKCTSCEGRTEPLNAQEVATLLSDAEGWQQDSGKKIWKEFTFKNFVQAIDFINRIADVAEYEDHHPDILLHDYKNVKVDLMTYAINGLSRNDFIVAEKINEIA